MAESSDQGGGGCSEEGEGHKGMGTFVAVLPDDLLMQVARKKTGKKVWESLKARFVGEERVKEARLQTLKSEFDALHMKRRSQSMAMQESLRACQFAMPILVVHWMMQHW